MGIGMAYERWQKKSFDELVPVILACGPEASLKKEFLEELKEQFPAEDREVVSLFADDTTPADFLRELRSQGLFSASKWVVLKHLEYRKGSQSELNKYYDVIEEYIQSPEPDTLLILDDADHPYTSGRKTGSLARLVEDSGGWTVIFWELFDRSLRRRVKNKFQEAEIEIEPPAVQLLMEKTHGQLEQLEMEAEKLIQLDKEKIERDDVEEIVSRQSAPDAYAEFKKHLAEGTLARALEALDELKRAGEAPNKIFYILFEYLHTLRRLRKLTRGRKNLTEAMKELGIPTSKGIVKKHRRALENISYEFPRDFYRESYRAGREVKYRPDPANFLSLEKYLFNVLPRIKSY